MTRMVLTGLFWLSLTAGLLACSSTPGPDRPAEQALDRSFVVRALPVAADPGSALDMIREAKEWQAEAAAVGGEWRDVQPLIEQAERAAAQGNYAKAIERAEFARFQAEMGFRQMRAQEQVVNPSFLYY